MLGGVSGVLKDVHGEISCVFLMVELENRLIGFSVIGFVLW